MPTDKQSLGIRGEKLVCATQHCPRCKRSRTLRTLPQNFKCADVICDFCGYLAQVKSFTAARTDQLPEQVLGAAWGPQNDRMDAGIYYPLYLVAIAPSGRSFGMWYLPADLQCAEMFVPRKPLSSKAKRAGWQGFIIDLGKAISPPVRVR
jgi:type II restriction enzyme